MNVCHTITPMILFFVRDLDENRAFLEEDEFRHCIKVLRKKEMDLINVTDGRGRFATAKIIHIAKSRAELQINEIEQKAAKENTLYLAIAPPKSKSRWEFILEKSVECGVDVILPFQSMHSERVKINVDRAKKIIRSAALQSKRIVHPSIANLCSLDALIDFAKNNDIESFIAHYQEDNTSLGKIGFNSKNQMLLIGPEGDFNPLELEKAIQAGFLPVKLSRNRLRTETAAMVAVTLIESLYMT